MNKRIFAFVIALLMAASALASCTDNETETDPPGSDAASGDADTQTGGDTTPADDNFAGTPAYTVDGDFIVVDGVQYPNKNNYNSGPMVAVDDLGRVLQTDAQTGGYTADQKNVGLFYFLWLGAHGDSGIHDVTKILEQGGDAAKKASYSGWGSVGMMHFWGEPLYGYYYSTDKWVMRKHAEELTNANVDFLYFDTTNGYAYTSTAKAMMTILDEFNQQGWDAPQIVFYTHSSSGNVVKTVYDSIYSKDHCPDTWFRIDDKPVVIAYEDECKASLGENADFFSYRVPQWPNAAAVSSGGWPWMDFERPQRVFRYKRVPEAISVSIAQHSGTVRFSDSAIYGNSTNRGRSFHEGRNDRTENAYLYGYNFQEQWNRAFETDVPIVLVTGWNEWVAQRQDPQGTDMVIFVDTASAEFSRDAEPMRGGYFDNYYLQLIDNIRTLKGTAPTLVQDTRKAIDINGSFDQWDDILVTYRDYEGDTRDRNSMSFGKNRLKDESGRNDLSAMKVTHDTKNLYFYVELAGGDEPDPITPFTTESTWMQLFLNVNGETDGWYGFDYIVNYKAKSESKTSLAKCTSTDNTFAYEESAELDYRVEGTKMMVKVPLAELGITDFSKINISFKWADSNDVIDTMEEMYTSGDTAPHGRLNFVFQNYK